MNLNPDHQLVYHNNKGNKRQKATLTSLTKVEKNIPKGKKGNKDDMLGQKPNKQMPKQMEVEMQLAVCCMIRILVGYENEKIFAIITTTKKEVNYQFWYPGRNKVIKE